MIIRSLSPCSYVCQLHCYEDARMALPGAASYIQLLRSLCLHMGHSALGASTIGAYALRSPGSCKEFAKASWSTTVRPLHEGVTHEQTSGANL